MLSDKLSVKKVNIEKTVMECHEEFDMLKFELKIEKKNWKKFNKKKKVVKIT